MKTQRNLPKNSSNRKVIVHQWIPILAVAAGVFFPVAGFCDTLYVTRFDDHQDGTCNSDCSLREAIDKTNQSTEHHVIRLREGTYTIDLPTDPYSEDDFGCCSNKDEDLNINGDFDITQSVDIVGESGGKTIINGRGVDRIFDIIEGTVLFKHLVLTAGRTPHYGGAIQNKGTLTLWYSSIIGNSASAGFVEGTGAGIANFGTLSLNASRVERNFASSGEGYPGRAGGIYNEGTLSIRESTIIGNRATDDNDSGSGGGLFNIGKADIRRSLFTKNESDDYFGKGSAIYNAGHLRLLSSTISENYAYAVFNKGAAVTNSSAIVRRNGRKDYSGEAYIYNTTITNNIGSGFNSNGNAYLQNVIIAGNVDSEEDPSANNCTIVNTNKHTFKHVILGEEDESSCDSSARFQVVTIDNTDTFIALLEPLADNGGPTLSHALRPNSIAIDAGNAKCPSQDQDRNTAPQDGDGDGIATCDIGAVEYHRD